MEPGIINPTSSAASGATDPRARDDRRDGAAVMSPQQQLRDGALTAGSPCLYWSGTSRSNGRRGGRQRGATSSAEQVATGARALKKGSDPVRLLAANLRSLAVAAYYGRQLIELSDWQSSMKPSSSPSTEGNASETSPEARTGPRGCLVPPAEGRRLLAKADDGGAGIAAESSPSSPADAKQLDPGSLAASARSAVSKDITRWLKRRMSTLTNLVRISGLASILAAGKLGLREFKETCGCGGRRVRASRRSRISVAGILQDRARGLRPDQVLSAAEYEADRSPHQFMQGHGQEAQQVTAASGAG